MTRKFAVGVSVMTKAQEEAFVSYLKERRVAWWHWIKGMWLVVDRRDSLSAKEIRDKLKEISHGGRSLVMEVGDGSAWAGSGPKLDGKSMFKWMHETWSKADDGEG